MDPAADEHRDDGGLPPLSGYTVAVTAERRREELGALLARRGARVVSAPTLRIVPLLDDAELRAATEAALARPLDLVVATTAAGFRGWLEAADAWRLPLRAHLARAVILARGPKARGAVRGAGLADPWSAVSESSAEVLEHLLSGAEGPLDGRRVAVQLHGDPLQEVLDGLRGAGAEVVPVRVYRWVPPEDGEPARRLIAGILGGGVDAVTFTSAPAAAGLLRAADDAAARADLVAALRDRVLAFAVGPATAAPLEEAGVPTVRPERWRLGALAREVVARLPARDPELRLGEHALQVRGHAAVLDGRLVPLPPDSLALLRVLAGRPAAVADLARQLRMPEPAVPPAVASLTAALGLPLVQGDPRAGYRLTG